MKRWEIEKFDRTIETIKKVKKLVIEIKHRRAGIQPIDDELEELESLVMVILDDMEGTVNAAYAAYEDEKDK